MSEAATVASSLAANVRVFATCQHCQHRRALDLATLAAAGVLARHEAKIGRRAARTWPMLKKYRVIGTAKKLAAQNYTRLGSSLSEHEEASSA